MYWGARGSSFRARPGVSSLHPFVTVVITTDRAHLLEGRRLVGSDFLDMTPEALVTKQQAATRATSELKTRVCQKTPSAE